MDGATSAHSFCAPGQGLSLNVARVSCSTLPAELTLTVLRLDTELNRKRVCFRVVLTSHSQSLLPHQGARRIQRIRARLHQNPREGPDVSRLAVSGRMDPRKNGPRHNFCSGKSEQAWSCAEPLRGGDVVSSLWDDGADHAETTLPWRGDDLRKRCLFRGVSAGRRKYRLSTIAVNRCSLQGGDV